MVENKIKIRIAKLKDIEKCYDIQKKDKEWTIKELEDSLKNIFIVAENKNEIIGYIIGYIDPCMKTDAIIHETRVKERYRHKGIGTMLVNDFCKFCFKKGIKDVSAGIQKEHLKFYYKCKFKKEMIWTNVSRKK